MGTKIESIEEIKPIQLATLDMKEYAAKRGLFTREEWMDVLMRAIYS